MTGTPARALLRRRTARVTGALRGDPATPDLRHLDAQRAQLLKRIHELAILLDLSVLEQKRVDEVVLVVTRRVVGVPDLPLSVALHPEPAGILCLVDLDILPLPVRKAPQRPLAVCLEFVVSMRDDRF